MVWIKSALDEYVNLDNVKAIFIQNDGQYDIFACIAPNMQTIIHKGNGSKEDSMKVLDDLMTKVK